MIPCNATDSFTRLIVRAGGECAAPAAGAGVGEKALDISAAARIHIREHGGLRGSSLRHEIQNPAQSRPAVERRCAFDHLNAGEIQGRGL